ncbi:MAG: hypothetical protein KGH55_00165 [Nanoarchaeota archaeon]|nr:hypothetical protein [Nanoarchaeota archaeon]
MELEEGDVVLCTVERIEGTNVFVSIEGDGEGIIMTSEIAAGRIRNLRDYVVPKKKIVCKVLRVSGNRIDLSLRRVTQKEQKEIMEQHDSEKSYLSILRTILGDKSQEAIEKIRETGRVTEFFESAKENPEELEKIAGQESSKKILEIINSQKKKIFILKKEIILKTTKPNGLEIIKGILTGIKGISVRYISAGHYSLTSESPDVKKADLAISAVISDIEKSAKNNSMEFSITEK